MFAGAGDEVATPPPTPPEPEPPEQRDWHGVARWLGTYKARVMVAGQRLTLLSTDSPEVAALAVNTFRQRMLALDPTCGLTIAGVNSVPEGLELSGKQRLKVEQAVAAGLAAVGRARAARAAAAKARKKQAPGAGSLPGALRNLRACRPGLRRQLLLVLGYLATGELPASATVVEFALAAAVNFVRRRQQSPTGSRWPKRVKELFALAVSQNSPERAMDILNGDTASPNIPVPSRHTAQRLVRAQAPEEAPFAGVSKERVSAFVAGMRDAGLTPCMFAALDGTDVQVGSLGV